MNWRLALAILCAPMIVGASNADHQLKVGQPAPDFKLRLVRGGSVSLSELRGKVVVINLWATWCGPCKEEMPALDLMQVNGGAHGLQIYGVLAADTAERSFIARIQKVLHYPLSVYINDDYPPIGGAVPTNYIIDRKGVLRYARSGSLTKESFADILVPLINEPA